jgi:CubicO group peptidase (beta-lactamase class C family)
MKLIKLLRFCAYLVCFAAIAAPATVDSAKALEGFDASVSHAMRELQAPGVAVGAIVDGRVILAKGYGVRELGPSATVTPDTIFAVGSMTKSFTAVTVAAMVDEGKLNWDRPVREYLPWFRMYDPVASDLITPRDLLTHRSGMPGHNFIRFSTPLERGIGPADSLPEPIIPSRNLSYGNRCTLRLVFGGEVAGKSWEDLVEQRIFTPLGMTNSAVRVAGTQSAKGFSQTHQPNCTVTSTDFTLPELRRWSQWRGQLHHQRPLNFYISSDNSGQTAGSSSPPKCSVHSRHRHRAGAPTQLAGRHASSRPCGFAARWRDHGIHFDDGPDTGDQNRSGCRE